jgi:outer membrane protein OmpA-like peptidoglycan-associated protein
MSIGIPNRVTVDYETNRQLTASLINYAIGSPYPGPDQKAWLQQNVVERFRGQDVYVGILGFTTRSGSPAWNKIVARSRALNVANFLVGQGLQVVERVDIQTLTDSPEAPLTEDGAWRGVTVNVEPT